MVPKICSVDGCTENSKARGWCKVHYMRWWKTGDPGTDLRKRAKGTVLNINAEEFWDNVVKTDSCWTWTGAKVRGYGSFTLNGKRSYAHRISWEKSNAKIPSGMIADHICHNPPCVNPSHLRIVTYRENSQNRTGAQKDSKSGIRGVYWDKGKNKWRTQVRHLGKKFHAGAYSTLEEAEAAVIAKRNELFTHNDLDRVA